MFGREDGCGVRRSSGIRLAVVVALAWLGTVKTSEIDKEVNEVAADDVVVRVDGGRVCRDVKLGGQMEQERFVDAAILRDPGAWLVNCRSRSKNREGRVCALTHLAEHVEQALKSELTRQEALDDARHAVKDRVIVHRSDEVVDVGNGVG